MKKASLCLLVAVLIAGVSPVHAAESGPARRFSLKEQIVMAVSAVKKRAKLVSATAAAGGAMWLGACASAPAGSQTSGHSAYAIDPKTAENFPRAVNPNNSDVYLDNGDLVIPRM